MPFTRGQSGNPKGRTPGNVTVATLRKAIAEHAGEILDAVLVAAKGGDIGACKLLLDRICPPLKAQALSISLPGAVNHPLADQGAEVVKATLAGKISPDIGAQILAALGSQIRILEVTDLAERVTALEKKAP